ncbi:MAG: hypothetical protein KC425_09415 [Anaerolineales bacterium]|nr:hypothetical protein [Anaerolineales bacterium]
MSAKKPALLAWLLGALLFVAVRLATADAPAVETLFPPILADDLNQHRLDTALPPPQGAFVITQSFTPAHDGLQELSFLLVRWEEGVDGRLIFKLRDAAGRLVVEARLDSTGVAHNQAHTLRFPPQRDSAGRPYRLEISGSATNPLSVWGYSLDAVAGAAAIAPAPGRLDDAPLPETAAQDLRFSSRYRLTWGAALGVLGGDARQHGPYLLLALLLLPLPGALLLLIWPQRQARWPAAVWVGVALALGVAAWPLLWQALTLLGGRWTGPALWAAAGVGWAAAALLGAFRWREARRAVQWRAASAHMLLLGVLLLGLAVRLLAVRDLNVPPWVDASRHGLITAVMIENGQTIRDYAPFLAVDRFPYHFGFHTLAASLGLMTDWALPDLLLYLGQLLNALLPLTVYTAVWLVTRRQGAGLLAAFLVALPFFFPAYYATWGRFTQLTAMLGMPVLLASTWQLLRGARGWRRAWWLVGVLAAGLFMLHFRVFVFFVPFVLVAWGVSWGRNGRWLAAAGALALMLVSPRAWQLWRLLAPAEAAGGGIANYNAFPVSYFQVGWEMAFVWLAAAAALFVLAAGARRRAWAVFPVGLLLWVGLLFVGLSGEQLGLPQTTLVNMNSMVITLFVPLALLLGTAGERAWRWLQRWRWSAVPAQTAAGALLAAALLFGVRQQATILNAETILAWPADRAALAWVDANLPADARVAVNSWLWLGSTWAGGDGGAWLLPLTGRASTTPPADYIYDAALAREVAAFNEAATAVEDWADPAQAAWLRAQGVTHVFVGQRGGFFDPAALARNPGLERVYGREGVFVFAIRP